MRLDHPALDGGEQRLAAGEREADVFRPLRRLGKRRDLFAVADGAVIIGDPEQNAMRMVTSAAQAGAERASFPQVSEWKAHAGSATRSGGHLATDRAALADQLALRTE